MGNTACRSHHGLAIRSDWVTRPRAGSTRVPAWSTRDQTVLEPNMTFHLVLGIWKKDFGYVFSETPAIAETGHEFLSTGTRELISKPSASSSGPP
jgi:hypothetical protein